LVKLAPCASLAQTWAWGQTYSKEFGRWMSEHGFDHMPKATRSVAIELAENAEAITAWRDGLPERERRRLNHPLSCTRRWRSETQPTDTPSPDLSVMPLSLGGDLCPAWRPCPRISNVSYGLRFKRALIWGFPRSALPRSGSGHRPTGPSDLTHQRAFLGEGGGFCLAGLKTGVISGKQQIPQQFQRDCDPITASPR
jgi:hypothetical protein